jgi:hypothetical protein
MFSPETLGMVELRLEMKGRNEGGGIGKGGCCEGGGGRGGESLGRREVGGIRFAVVPVPYMSHSTGVLG